MVDQLALPLHFRPLFQDALFFVGENNKEAFSWMQKKEWPCAMVCLWGPPQSGKTHLAHLWAKNVQAKWISFDFDFIEYHQHYILRWSDEYAKDSCSLLLFYDRVFERKAKVLWLAQKPPAAWALERKDLLSRFLTLPALQIGFPDDVLLKKILFKCFSDRQIDVEEYVLDYMIKRMSRSFEDIQSIVTLSDDYLLKTKSRHLTIPLLQKIKAL